MNSISVCAQYLYIDICPCTFLFLLVFTPCVCAQGLKLLHDGGLFYGHLHACNIIVDDAVCRLVDVENGMLGVPSILRPAFTQFRKINVRKDLIIFFFAFVDI